MKKRLLALTLLIAMLAVAIPAAANEPVQVLQANANATVYAAAAANSGTAFSVKKNDAVIAGEESGRYTHITVGSQSGYVETKRLRDINSSATVIAIAKADRATGLLKAPESTAKASATIAQGAYLSVLQSMAGYYAVRAGSAVGFVAAEDVTLFTASSAAGDYALFSSSVSLKNGTSSGAKTIATVPKGALVEVLDTLSKTSAVVRSGGNIGILSLQKATVYSPLSTAVEVMATTRSVTLYAGAGTKMTKLGTLAKGTNVNKLGVYGSYTVVSAGDIIGCIQTRYLASAASGTAGTTTADYNAAGLALITLTNQYRVSQGRSELAVDDALMQAALIRAKELAQVFSHKRPNGKWPNSLDSSILAENIAKGTPLNSPAKAAEGFIGSTEHSKNMLIKKFTKMGAAGVSIGGSYYWVQLFG